MIDEGGRREDVSSAQAAVAQAQASVDTAQRQLSDTYIRSPISGVVSARSADPGQIVSPGEVLARVVDLGSVYLKGDVPEKYLARVHKGQPVTVRIEAIPGSSFKGLVTEVYPSGSTSNRNFSVRVSIPGTSATVRPGMSASGEILIGRRQGVLLVSKDAVDDQEGTQSVFTVDADKIAHRHVITVIRTDRHNAEIAATTGLRVGDTVVTQGRKNLQDGAKVELRNGRRSSNVAH
jgi:RND family efflux transporter MFP subunit